LKKLKKACGQNPSVISSASGQGVQEVLQALLTVIDQAKAEDEPARAQEEWHP
jgi:GTP-binding protein